MQSIVGFPKNLHPREVLFIEKFVKELHEQGLIVYLDLHEFLLSKPFPMQSEQRFSPRCHISSRSIASNTYCLLICWIVNGIDRMLK